MASFNFNGHDFSELLLVNDIQRPVLPNLTTVMQDVGSYKGSLFNYNSYSSREITVEYTAIAKSPEDLVTVKQTVAGLLFTDQPAKLIFSDSPDRYFLAIPDGEFEMDQTGNVGQGSITFLVPDGVAHAVNTKEFVAVQTADNTLEVEVNNEGTEECPVNIEALFSSDNGVFAAVSPYGIIEVGSMEEVDGHDYQATDVVAKNTLTPADKENWTENSSEARTIYPVAVSGVPNSVGTGSFTWKEGSEGPTVSYSNRGLKYWAGPTLHRPIPPNSNGINTGNFDAIWRFTFKNPKANQSGRHEFNLQNGTEVPFAFVMRDSSKAKVETIAEFYLKEPSSTEKPQLTSVALDLKKIKTSWWEIRISREGSKVTFKLSNIKNLKGDYGNEDVKEAYYTVTKTFTLDWAAGLPVDGTTYWAQAADSSSEPVTGIPSNFTFRWVNVDKWANDPNRYKDGDVMFIDSVNGKTYLNDALILNDVVKGSEYIKVPAGRTKIQFVTSGFASPPAVRAIIQEVYL